MSDETRVTPSDAPHPGVPASGDTAGPADPNATLGHAPAPAAPGRAEVPGYEILGELGRGGMGVVYRARHLKLDRVVALKMVLSAEHADPRELARFLDEAKAVAAIRHPNVVEVFDSGEADGRPFMAMECLDGGSLVGRLRAGGALPARAAAELVLKLARGVQAAHDRGIVHRDLKPHNVLLDTSGEPKVTDFGLAKRGDGAHLTTTGAVMGTPAYMAPEQARGDTKAVGPAADVYALGVILYECLSGTVPFAGADAWSVIRQVIADEPEPVARRCPGAPRELDLICRKCLEKAPADRYASAADLADDLQRYLNGEPLRGARGGLLLTARALARRYRKPAVVVLCAVAALGAVLATRGGSGPKADDKPDDPLVALRKQEVLRRVEVLRQTPPPPDLPSPHPIEEVGELPNPDRTAFRILDDDRTVDLRAWRALAPGENPRNSRVVNVTRQRYLKTAPADAFASEARTTGADVVMRVLAPNPSTARGFVLRAQVNVGREAMKRRQVRADVSALPIGSEFDTRIESVYFGSLQSHDEQWFGVVGNGESVKVAMLMLFPEAKPFRAFELKVAPTRNAPPEPYTGPVITFAGEDKSWLYWEIVSPQAGFVYRVDWEW